MLVIAIALLIIAFGGFAWLAKTVNDPRMLWLLGAAVACGYVYQVRPSVTIQFSLHQTRSSFLVVSGCALRITIAAEERISRPVQRGACVGMRGVKLGPSVRELHSLHQMHLQQLRVLQGVLHPTSCTIGIQKEVAVAEGNHVRI